MLRPFVPPVCVKQNEDKHVFEEELVNLDSYSDLITLVYMGLVSSVIIDLSDIKQKKMILNHSTIYKRGVSVCFFVCMFFFLIDIMVR